MKRVLFVTLTALALLAACAPAPEKAAAPEPAPTAEVETAAAPELETVKFKVEGMVCTNCEDAIKGEVGKIEAVKNVTASHVKLETEVTFDPGGASRDQIKTAIEKLGFKAVISVEG